MPEEQPLNTVSFQSAIHDVKVYGLILLDSEGCVVTWNSGAIQLLGYSEAEVIGRNFEFIFTPEDRSKNIPQREMATALSQGHAYDDRWHLRKDQSQLYVNGGLCLLKNDAGQPLGFVKIIRDQTERKEHLEKIEELNEELVRAHVTLENYAASLETKVHERTLTLNERTGELQDFCYSIAHDLRAPLRSIQAMSHVVVEEYGKALDAKGKEYLERMAKAASHLDKLTLDLLEYTRFTREEIKLTSISLEKVIDEVLLVVEGNTLQSKATIHVQRPLPQVKGQHAYIVQILGNFLSNALKFVKPGCNPTIDIWTETKDQRVRIYLKDNGIGIPPEYREKIFLLFERLHPQTSFEGTGAGLAIARKAAQRMEGDIGILSHSDEGCTFWLELEVAE